MLKCGLVIINLTVLSSLRKLLLVITNLDNNGVASVNRRGLRKKCALPEKNSPGRLNMVIIR